MRWQYILLSVFLVFLGCSDENNTTDSNDSVEMNITQEVPSTTKQHNRIGDVTYYSSDVIESYYIDEDSLALHAYEGIISGVVIRDIDTSSGILPRERTVRSVLDDLNNKLALFESRLYSLNGIRSVSKIAQSSYIFPFDQTTAEYKVSTYSSTTTSKLLQNILSSTFGKNNYPVNENNSSNEYRIRASISKVNNDIYYILSVLPELYKDGYGELATNMVRATHLADSNATVSVVKDSFIQTGGNDSADFLFVIDDSGSMSEEQAAVRQAANDFEKAILNSNIKNYNIALISTGENISNTSCTYSVRNCASALVNQYTSFNNIADFQQHVVLGTSGSGVETGIYNAETALKDGGVLSVKGFPNNGNLSIIIISDEKSQYSSRGYNSFNLYENVFTKNAYQVYSIIDEYDPGDYKNLADVTGGFSASIEQKNSVTNQLDFSELMEKVAVGASGATSKFALSRGSESHYIVNIQSVKVNAHDINESLDNGWAYSVTNNSIGFYGAAKPLENDVIDVEYSITEVHDFVSVVSKCSIKNLQECTTQEQCSDIKDAIWVNDKCSIVEKVCSTLTPEYCNESECNSLNNYVWDSSTSACKAYVKSQAQIDCENGGYTWEIVVDTGIEYCNIPVNPADYIGFSGTIFDPISQTPLSGVNVTATAGSDAHSSTTDSNGNFSFKDLLPNTYKLKIEKDSYTAVEAEVSPSKGETVFIGQVNMVPSGDGSIYNFNGELINAINGVEISNALIEIHSGYQSPNGALVQEFYTDGDGEYNTTLETGYYTLVVKKSGYITRETNVLIWDDNVTQGLTLSPVLAASEEMRITLTWGEKPSDLDAHLAVMNGADRSEHIYFSNKQNVDNSIVLDRDDAQSYGPETITVSSVDSNLVYKFYVHEYASDIFSAGQEVSRSSATVTVDTKSNSYVFNVPNGNGTAWKVFEISNGMVTACSEECIFYSYSVVDKQFGDK